MARRRIERVPPPEHRFACPLCRDALGLEIIIVAELDASPGFLSVADFSGCAHAEVFGLPDQLTAEEEARLITAALDTYEARRGPSTSGSLPGEH